MKTLLLVGVIVVVMGGLVLIAEYDPKPEEGTNVKLDTATTTVEAVEEMPEEWLKEAEEARQAVIDRKRAEAELNDVQGQIEALRVRETELEKELNVY
jgi:hypothetical protein